MIRNESFRVTNIARFSESNRPIIIAQTTTNINWKSFTIKNDNGLTIQQPPSHWNNFIFSRNKTKSSRDIFFHLFISFFFIKLINFVKIAKILVQDYEIPKIRSDYSDKLKLAF